MQLTPDRLVAGGDAMARDVDGRVVFIEGALPGEVVEVEIEAARKDFARARIVEIIERSPVRDSPSCAHRRAGCGGCGWMHLRPEAQFEAKSGIVRESLRRIGRLADERIEEIVVPGGSVTPFGYRTTIRVVGGADGTLGFREHASDRVVPVTSCPVADSKLSRLLPLIGVDEGAELTLRTSVATGAITAIWDKRYRTAIRGLPDGVHIGERAWLTERVAGHDLRVSAGSFFQSGVQAAELLVAAVAQAAPELASARHALDAYGGVGLFAVTTMSGADQVTVVESSASACRDADHNLAEYRLTGRTASVVRAEVSGWSAPDGAGPTPPVDVIVADPARTGLGRPGVASLAAAGAPVMVLVSCDPVSLARDAVLLADAGYHPERIEVLDLFPQTPHVETVARFVRA
ncbi:MAG TPA: TRAM domain-containing protein [Ilumatobacteraceae bacterium]|nr:TRAM domain-containing protein [Ilumatobacteraceae bacterium]